MKGFVAFLLVSTFLLPARGENTDNACPSGNGAWTVTYRLPRRPNYFFKMSPDGRYLYYISGASNYMIDLQTGVETKLPGNADPVPSADGELLTFMSRESPSKPFSASVMPMARPWQPDLAATSTALNTPPGSYQSVGTPQGPLGDRPYLFQDESTGEIVIYGLRSQGGSFSLVDERRLPGQGRRLPMMSPDGKLMSVLNTETKRTEIWDISGTQSRRVRELPFVTGKVGFSMDGKQITFHVRHATGAGGRKSDVGYPAEMGTGEQVLDVYTMDLGSGELQQVTNNTSSDAYFPILLADGRVAYFLESAMNMDTGERSFDLVISTVPDRTSRSLERVSACYGGDTTAALESLANSWFEVCLGAKTEAGPNGLARMLTLSDDACRALAKKTQNESHSQICRAMAGEAAVSPVAVTRTPKANVHPGEALIRTQCMICHVEGMTWFKNRERQVLTSIRGESQPRMPMGGENLTDEQEAQIAAYLAQFGLLD
jgi:mono/diheme cytochrome c family protein